MISAMVTETRDLHAPLITAEDSVLIIRLGSVSQILRSLSGGSYHSICTMVLNISVISLRPIVVSRQILPSDLRMHA